MNSVPVLPDAEDTLEMHDVDALLKQLDEMMPPPTLSDHADRVLKLLDEILS